VFGPNADGKITFITENPAVKQVMIHPETNWISAKRHLFLPVANST
jgi:hypothetical protein